MRIKLNSVFVDDREKALKFYTDVLGFVKMIDIPEIRWPTVASPEEPGGAQLLLESDDNPAARTFKQAIYAKGIPLTTFQVDDVQAEYERMQNLGVIFSMPPTNMGASTVAVFDDTCGNLIQIYQV